MEEQWENVCMYIYETQSLQIKCCSWEIVLWELITYKSTWCFQREHLSLGTCFLSSLPQSNKTFLTLLLEAYVCVNLFFPLVPLFSFHFSLCLLGISEVYVVWWVRICSGLLVMQGWGLYLALYLRTFPVLCWPEYSESLYRALLLGWESLQQPTDLPERLGV